MKTFFQVLVFLLSTSSTSSASPQVHLRPSFILGLWGFASYGSGHVGSQIVKDVYDKSSDHTPENDRRLNAISTLVVENFNEGFGFHSALEGRAEQGWDISSHYDYQAARSKSLEEFRSRTQGVIPIVRQQELFRLLTELEPLYRRLIWLPSLAQLKRDQARLEKLMKKSKVAEILGQQIKFYRGNWQDNDPLTMMLIPIPAAKGATHATVIGDTGLVQVLKGEADLNGRFGVIMHEIGHSLYASENLDFQKEMAKWFSESKVPTAMIALQTWEEVLSTVTGNGWAYERARGFADPGNWYNNKEYDGLSKAIYPLAKTYLESGRPMDKAFVDEAIAQFEKLFPDASRRNRRLLRRVIIVENGRAWEQTELTKKISSEYHWIRHLEFLSAANPQEDSRKLSERPDGTALLFINHSDQPFNLKVFEKTAPELKTLSGMAKGTGYATALDSRGRLVILVNAKDLQELNAILSGIQPDDAASKSPQFYPK